MRWRIGGEPTPVPTSGDDEKWRWTLVDTFMGALHTTYFAITRSALNSEELPTNVDRARATHGRSELEPIPRLRPPARTHRGRRHQPPSDRRATGLNGGRTAPNMGEKNPPRWAPFPWARS